MPQGTNEWLHDKVEQLDESIHDIGMSLHQSAEWDSRLYRRYRELKAERNAYLNCIIHIAKEELTDD